MNDASTPPVAARAIPFDTAKAVAFLQRWPTAFPVLTAIAPSKKSIETKSFGGAGNVDWKAVHDWIEARQNRFNLYFSVNELMEPMDKKSERTDIRKVVALHTDIDPRVGESLAEERIRIRGMLDRYDPRPNIAIFSGGGCQGFWFLADPIMIDGNLEKAEDAKRYSQFIEQKLDAGGTKADPVHNIDRIMRIPFTVNVPDAKKVAKGRVPALAEVEWFDDVSYALDLFPQATLAQATPLPGAAAPIDTTGEFLASLDELPPGVAAECRVTILTGNNSAKSYPGRSEALCAVCIHLVLAKVPDKQIYAVITDPKFRISDSVSDKGRGMRRYALRQIQRAHEFTHDPDLAAMNDEHAIVMIGDKLRVLSWKPSPIYPTVKVPTYTMKGDFCEFHSNRRKRWTDKDGEHEQPLGAWWFRREDRRQANGVIYAPGVDEERVDGELNIWRGFTVAPEEGDCQLYLDHLLHNICSGNEAHYSYLLNWMARAVQQPMKLGLTAVVMRGKEGTGKGVFVKTFGQLFGPHYQQILQAKHLVGNFNDHLQQCSVLFADEAFFAGDKAHEGVLKGLITEDTIQIEPKGLGKFEVANRLHIVMASNKGRVIPAGTEARRYFVLNVSAAHIGDIPYFRAIAEQMDNGGREALLHFLLTRDIENFYPFPVPLTEGLSQQQEFTGGTLKDRLVDVRGEEWEVRETGGRITYEERIGSTFLLKFLNTPEWPKTTAEELVDPMEALGWVGPDKNRMEHGDYNSKSGYRRPIATKDRGGAKRQRELFLVEVAHPAAAQLLRIEREREASQ